MLTAIKCETVVLLVLDDLQQFEHVRLLLFIYNCVDIYVVHKWSRRSSVVHKVPVKHYASKYLCFWCVYVPMIFVSGIQLFCKKTGCWKCFLRSFLYSQQFGITCCNIAWVIVRTSGISWSCICFTEFCGSWWLLFYVLCISFPTYVCTIIWIADFFIFYFVTRHEIDFRYCFEVILVPVHEFLHILFRLLTVAV